MIKTFRGLLTDGEQEKIRLSTKKGKIGYKIVKFKIIANEPGDAHMEHTMKIFKVTQTVINNTIDFSDGNLLGAAFLVGNANEYSVGDIIIFEQEIFNQDIYITHEDSGGSNSCNYYLELEAMVLTDNAASVSTLRDIRLNPQVGA